MSFPVLSESSKAHLVKLKVDGTGTAVLTGSGRNLAELTDNGVGDYTITFSPALSEPPAVVAIPYTAGVNVGLHSAPTGSEVRLLSKSSSEVPASLLLNGIRFTAHGKGTIGNSLTVTITGGATAGSEVVTCTSAGALTIQVESGVSTATQVFASLINDESATENWNAHMGATLVTGATTWATATAASLAGGLDVGDAVDADFDVLCLIDKL